MKPLVTWLALAALAACGDEPKNSLADFVPAQAGQLTFKVPSRWQRVETTGAMRKGEWRVPGEGAPDATFTVYSFGGAAGSVAQNLERWQNQFEQQPPGNAKPGQLRFPGRPLMDTLEVRGTYVAETSPGSGERHHDAGWKMTAVVVTVGSSTYYLKFVGPEATIDRWAEDFHVALGQIRG